MKHIATVLIVSILPIAAGARSAAADEFLLRAGGRLSGELVNADESPRKNYVIQTAHGARVTLDRSQVSKVVRRTPAEKQYRQIRPSYEDTVARQWELAEWCREKNLNEHRKTHLRRIVQLDPDHVKARRVLGYSHIDGRWATQEELMIARGYQRYNGAWRSAQEIELIEQKRKTELAEKDWAVKLKRWRTWLDGNKSDRVMEARRGILAIKDPQAVLPLIRGLQSDDVPEARVLYIEALDNISTLRAIEALAVCSLEDPVEEVRLTCLDYLEKKQHPHVVDYYVGKLRSKDNRVVNLAAVGLGRMNDLSATGPLIDALVTIHKYKIVTSNPGSTSATFPTGGRGGGGLSVGSSPIIFEDQRANQAVLDALARLTGQNFNFDQRAWKYWLASQRQRPTLDARRD